MDAGSSPAVTLNHESEVRTVLMKQKQKAKRYSIMRSTYELEMEIPQLPENEVYKMVSDGRFSSISFVKYIADRTKIHEMYVSSFRIGRKELQLIDALHDTGRIGMCHFAVGTLMENDGSRGKKYHYYDDFKNVCDKNGWEYITVNNHSKILLFDTDTGKYVIETSSNLNENPKIEQFSFERDEGLYDFYRGAFARWGDADA